MRNVLHYIMCFLSKIKNANKTTFCCILSFKKDRNVTPENNIHITVSGDRCYILQFDIPIKTIAALKRHYSFVYKELNIKCR